VIRFLLLPWPWPWSCFTISTTLDTVSINRMSGCGPPGLLLIGVGECPRLLQRHINQYVKKHKPT